ncbi:hypothetical protein BDV29DRAFT_181968 [Aspergillus leporis]|uniref:N-acetyltransferase domain-containing protein n=1 Tax=Aspergillus leporis TaxID=41062 RepID=A0A5N5WQ94_9EURO|nr:hypothetical protein BDV29DRAFT_181968 [Aspergillus leporis]
MITSDESGVVMFRGGNKASTGAKPIPQGTPKKDTPQRIPGPQTTQVGNKGANTAQRNVGKESNKSNKGNTSTGNDPSPSKSAGPSKEEVMEELNRLRAEIVQRAHLNRFKDLDYPTANPEILKRCRNGPGCDPNSNFFLSITKCRLAPIQSADISSATAGQFSHGYEALKTSPSYPQDPTVQWKEYEDSPAMYPIVRNGELSLSPDPIDEHEHIPEMLARSGLQTGAVNQYTGSTQEQKHSWTDAFYADWEYRPQACSSYEAFRDWFRRWLDTTIHICCYADIYHRAFFDGTAHPDGVRTMFIPDLESSTTFLSMDDEESRFHGQETVEGYCFNWEIHAKKDRDEEQFRRKIQRDHYLEGLKKFPLPRASVLKANVYFRPVEVGDVPGLIEIFNYYGLNSPLSTHIKALEAGDIRQIIDDSNEEKLPFIVAAERRVGAIANSGREKIFGYALATDFLGQGTSGRFTAELEIFVKPGHMRKGIGKCLIDKILEVCDATYIPKRGYFFDSNWDDRSGYWAGGRRRLGRSWIEEWLKRDYGFKEQGRLVRNVGYHGNDRFES